MEIKFRVTRYKLIKYLNKLNYESDSIKLIIPECYILVDDCDLAISSYTLLSSQLTSNRCPSQTIHVKSCIKYGVAAK